MNYKLYKLTYKLKKILINLIPNKETRHELIYKIKLKNSIHGIGNIIEGKIPKGLKIDINGDNNRIVIGNDSSCFNGTLTIGTSGCPVDNSTIIIGDGSSCGFCNFNIMEDNSSIIIGKDCMFSSGIDIFCTDFHSVLDLDGNLTNCGHSITIGNHVWVGMGVKICKNTSIAANSIVGCGSVVTKKFAEPNVVIAGNPAQIVKHAVNWDRKSPKQYLEKHS